MIKKRDNLRALLPQKTTLFIALLKHLQQGRNPLVSPDSGESKDERGKKHF